MAKSKNQGTWRERRTRYKVEASGVSVVVDGLLAQGVTYEQIEEHLRGLGVEVGKSSIARYNNAIQRKLRRVSQIRESAEAMAKVFGEKTGTEPDTQLSELLLGTMQATLLDKFGEEELSIKEAVGLSLAGSQSVRAASQLEKVRSTERARYGRAWDRVMKEAKELLRGEGDLWLRVEDVLVRGKAATLAEGDHGA